MFTAARTNHVIDPRSVRDPRLEDSEEAGDWTEEEDQSDDDPEDDDDDGADDSPDEDDDEEDSDTAAFG